jgi:hypothetical protein
MRIRNWTQFLESLQSDINLQNLTESLKIWHDILLSSIGAQFVDIFDELKLSDSLKDKLDIDFLDRNVEFLNGLSSLGLKKSTPQKTDDFETFVNKPCKFMMIYDQNSNELENPEYILFQSWNETLKKWDSAKLYKLTEDIKKFYDKLTSRTIEITDKEKNYIYSTSNGNDWVLDNPDNLTDKWKKTLRKEELEELLDDSVKLTII